MCTTAVGINEARQGGRKAGTDEQVQVFDVQQCRQGWFDTIAGRHRITRVKFEFPEQHRLAIRQPV